ncbi:MAG: hypothetical protein HYV67_01745 [Candidatus Taylorbacteria bacterium]|nr:hypothetical protein [Candidatus Taylorbacteria bacterium]
MKDRKIAIALAKSAARARELEHHPKLKGQTIHFTVESRTAKASDLITRPNRFALI